MTFPNLDKFFLSEKRNNNTNNISKYTIVEGNYESGMLFINEKLSQKDILYVVDIEANAGTFLEVCSHINIVSVMHFITYGEKYNSVDYICFIDINAILFEIFRQKIELRKIMLDNIHYFISTRLPGLICLVSVVTNNVINIIGGYKRKSNRINIITLYELGNINTNVGKYSDALFTSLLSIISKENIIPYKNITIQPKEDMKKCSYGTNYFEDGGFMVHRFLNELYVTNKRKKHVVRIFDMYLHKYITFYKSRFVG